MRAIPDSANDEVSLSELLIRLRKNRLFIIGLTLLFFALGILLAYLIRPIYRAQVTMVPVPALNSGSSGFSIASQLPGLAGIVGLGPNDESKVEALATLKARSLTSDYINEHNLMPLLFEASWDSTSGKWAVPEEEMPTLWDAYTLFDQNVRRVAEDRSTGVVTLTIDWHDPDTAAAWANSLVKKLNDEMRARAVNEAEQNLDYLRKQLENNSLVEIRQGLSRLIEMQINNVMLANSREEYSFRVIDPAVPPDIDSFIKPNRPLLIVGGAAAGFALSIFLVFAIAAVSRSIV